MELELSEVENGEDLAEWARAHNAGLVGDGSLDEKGVEIVTSPSAGDIFIADAESLGETLKEIGAQIGDSCGLHTHADARDFTQADLRRVIVLYSAVERVMFELVSRSRMGNHYCQPCGFKYLQMLENDTSKGHKEFRRHLHTVLYTEKDESEFDGRLVKSRKQDKYQSSRYYALNLHSYFYRKTIEFRLHESHLNPKVFINWSLFCGWIVEKAYTLSERQMLELMLKHQHGNGESLLLDILPPDVSEWLLTRLQERRKAREQGGSMESTETRLEAYTTPKDTLRADIWHTNAKEIA